MTSSRDDDDNDVGLRERGGRIGCVVVVIVDDGDDEVGAVDVDAEGRDDVDEDKS